ncbi:MAG: CAP domain-containing protein [Marmoricola sp.]
MALGTRRASRRRALVGSLATIMAGLLATSAATPADAAPGAALSAGTTAGTTTVTAAVTAVDTRSRQAVTAAYRRLWLPAAAAPLQLSGGDPDSCTPYRTAAESQTRTRDAINFARGLAGLRPLTSVSDTHTAVAGLSALLQASNRSLSHSPPSSWLCWTLAAATAAGRSNLDLRWSTGGGPLPTPADIVSDYLVDRGTPNTEVGHRRWLLRPGATTMGSGNAVVSDGDTQYVANDLWVLPSLLAGAPAGTPAFYGWPAAGWFPSPLEPEGRWSLSSSTGADFSHATVRVTRDGVAVPVNVQPTAIGYADNTLVWQLATPPAATGATAHTYDVTVRGIAGARTSTYSYSVRLFDPTWSDPAWSSPVVPASTAGTPTRTAVRWGTAMRVRPASHRVRLHHRPRLAVVVAGHGTPQGRVVVRVDRHRVGSWQLRDGRRSIRLPRTGHRGTHRVVVRYVGTSQWQPDTARTTLRVR